MSDLITTDLVRLDADLGADKHDVIRALAAGRRRRRPRHRRRAARRRRARPRGDRAHRPPRRHRDPALPHRPASTSPRSPSPGSRPPVDFGAKDGPADLAFLIAAPGRRRRHPPQAAHQAGPGAGQAGLHRRAARRRVRRRRSSTLVSDVVGAGPAAARRRARRRPPPWPAAAASAAAAPRRRSRGPGRPPRPRRVAAAWSRSPPARPASPTPTWPPRPSRPPPSAPASRSRSRPRARPAPRRCPATRSPRAAAVIFAVDVGVRDRGRFAGKPVVSSGVKRPIDDGRRDDRRGPALRRRPQRPARRGRGHRGRGRRRRAGETWGGRTRRVLMTGVSYMIPFVAAGGLLIALSFLLGGYEIVGPYGDIAVNNTLFNLPDPEALGLDHALFGLRLLRLLRRPVLHHRQDRVRAVHPGARRLHRLRDRRPARHRPRLRAWVAWPPTCSTCSRRVTTRRRSRPPASSAPSSAASSPASSPTGSPAGRCPPGRAA